MPETVPSLPSVLQTGVCGIMALFVHLTETMSKPRRKALMLLEISAMILMIADRHAYMSRGDITAKGWWLVRIRMKFYLFSAAMISGSFSSTSSFSSWQVPAL